MHAERTPIDLTKLQLPKGTFAFSLAFWLEKKIYRDSSGKNDAELHRLANAILSTTDTYT